MGADMTFDPESDELDGALFRFWIRAGSQFPGETAKAIANATTAAEYRKALTELAHRKGVNLPPPAPATPTVSRALEIVLSRCKMHSGTASDLRYLLEGARMKERSGV